MDRYNIGRGAVSSSAVIERIQDHAADQLDSTARHVLTGCIEGLQLDLAADTVGPGESYLAGRRYRLKVAVAAGLGAVVRPATGMSVWASVIARYGTVSTGTVRDREGGERPELIEEICTISVETGAVAAAPARPDVPESTILIADLLIDHDTALDALTADYTRRVLCHPDRLQIEVDAINTALRSALDAIADLQQRAAVALVPRPPNQPGAPSGTSPSPLRIRWIFVAPGTNNSPLTAVRLQWRIDGDSGWDTNRIINLQTSEISAEHTVANADNDVLARVQYIAAAGAGPWSPPGRLAAADIMQDPAANDIVFDTPGMHETTWPLRGVSRARVTIMGASGGGGTDGTGGGPGANARQVTSSGRYRTETVTEGFYRTMTARAGGIFSNGGAPLTETPVASNCFTAVTYTTVTETHDGVDYQVTSWSCNTRWRVWVPPVTRRVWVPGGTRWVSGARGADGVAGTFGTAGGDSSFSISSRSINVVADGGAGGAGGNPGQGGAGGSGANGQGRPGTAGGEGADGNPGQTRTVEVTGLTFGDRLTAVVGAAGAGSPPGMDGSVHIRPITE